MTSFARASLPIALLALVAGCKNNSIKSDNDYTTETVGAKGASLDLDDGASVYIPSEALTEDHAVTLGRVASSYPPFTGPAVLSPVYSLEPHDLTFKIAATLSIPATKGTLVFAPEHGTWMDLHGVMDGNGKLSGQSTLAGYFAVVDGGSGTVMAGDGGGPKMNGMQDGELIRSNFQAQAAGPGNGGLAIGDSYAFYISQTMDQFGVQTTSLQAMSLDSMDAPVAVATLGEMAGGSSLAAIGDYAYWSEGMAMPQNPAIVYRAKPGGAREMVATVGGQPGMVAFTAAEGSLLFVDQNGQLALYDGATGMLDPTQYGTASAGGSPYGGVPFTRSEDHVFFLTGGNTAPYEIWAGPIGSPATDTTMSFPGGAMLSAVGASGSTFVIVVSAGTQQNVIAFDTANPMSGPQTIGSFGSGGGGGGMSIAIGGGAVYAATYASGGATGDLVKFDVASGGMQSKVGTYLAQGSSRPVMVNSQYVFVAGPSQTGMGSDLYRWAR